MSDPFDELERHQALIVEKMAEIGWDVQLPISFAKHPSGPRIAQLAAVQEDPGKANSTLEEKDAFAAIVEAEKASELEKKVEKDRTAAEQALADLARLAGEDDDDDA